MSMLGTCDDTCSLVAERLTAENASIRATQAEGHLRSQLEGSKAVIDELQTAVDAATSELLEERKSRRSVTLLLLIESLHFGSRVRQLACICLL